MHSHLFWSLYLLHGYKSTLSYVSCAISPYLMISFLSVSLMFLPSAGKSPSQLFTPWSSNQLGSPALPAVDVCRQQFELDLHFFTLLYKPESNSRAISPRNFDRPGFLTLPAVNVWGLKRGTQTLHFASQKRNRSYKIWAYSHCPWSIAAVKSGSEFLHLSSRNKVPKSCHT